jgi:xanthine/CO dehydrogenase XdhC/CoxF family maturation factor
MRVWGAIAEAIEATGRCALVTVADVRGSAPREAGARLVVRPDGRFSGTIGGGTLEWRAIAEATAELVRGGAGRGVRRGYALGPELGQCCGGRVELLFETFGLADREAVAALAAREAAGPFETVGRVGADGRVVRQVVSGLKEDLLGTVPTGDFIAASAPPLPPPTGGGTPRAARQGGARQSEGDVPLVAPGRWRGRAPSDPAAPGHLPRKGGGFAPAGGLESGREFASNSSPSPTDFTDRLSTSTDGTVRERFGDDRRPLVLFGAGHVGRALLMALAPLPFAVTWVDARPEAFPRHVPANVTLSSEPDPEVVLAAAPDGAFVLSMTHSHPLDLAAVATALRQDRFPYVGVIGSATKRARFESQLRAAGHAEAAIASLVCPIGASGGLSSKEPAAIAAMTAAELLLADDAARRDRRRPATAPEGRFAVDAAAAPHDPAAARGPRRTRR